MKVSVTAFVVESLDVAETDKPRSGGAKLAVIDTDLVFEVELV